MQVWAVHLTGTCQWKADWRSPSCRAGRWPRHGAEEFSYRGRRSTPSSGLRPTRGGYRRWRSSARPGSTTTDVRGGCAAADGGAGLVGRWEAPSTWTIFRVWARFGLEPLRALFARVRWPPVATPDTKDNNSFFGRSESGRGDKETAATMPCTVAEIQLADTLLPRIAPGAASLRTRCRTARTCPRSMPRLEQRHCT